MPKNYTITDFVEMPREESYQQGQNLADVLHNIEWHFKEDYNKGLYNKWNIPYKQHQGFNIKIHGTGEKPVIELRVTEFHGGFRVPAELSINLVNRGKDTIKLLEQFEKAVKKEFKARTGKALTYVGKPTVDVNWQRVAVNGLYQFWATKTGVVKTELKSSEYPERKVV